MSGETGANELARLGGKDLNNDGQIINLVVVGSSRYYDEKCLLLGSQQGKKAASEK